MKTLTSLAVFPLMAAAASALTLDVNVGAASPSGYDSNAIVGVGIGTQLNNEFHLGLNLSSSKYVSTGAVDATARAASLDLTYELNGNGSIRPFIGAGVGNVWFSGASMNSKNAMTTNLFVGMSFRVSDTVDVILTERNAEVYDVQELPSGVKKSVNSWQSSAGLRFKF